MELDHFEITPDAYQSADVYQSMTIDNWGMPKYNVKLKKIPDTIGSPYVLVFKNEKDLPVKALSMVIAKYQEKADPARPIKVIFEWTQKGFLTGLSVWGGGGGNGGGSASPSSGSGCLSGGGGKDAIALLAIVGIVVGLVVVVFATAPIIGGTGGFVVGLTQSPVEATQEVKKSLTDRMPLALVYLSYHYEGAGRLVGINQYIASNPARLVVETEYHYRPFEFKPYKAVVKSIPEKKTRTITFP